MDNIDLLLTKIEELKTDFNTFKTEIKTDFNSIWNFKDEINKQIMDLTFRLTNLETKHMETCGAMNRRKDDWKKILYPVITMLLGVLVMFVLQNGDKIFKR